ncbi:hypothetical protein MKX01_018752 [Papaver californicum]|nr:hypothetical protein MKX01_018752 [Papaver californicum]
MASATFLAFCNSPVGPKTTYFWGPVSTSSLFISFRLLIDDSCTLIDTQKPPEMIPGNMTGALCVASMLLMRFAWMVQPRNYLLLVCHASNETVQPLSVLSIGLISWIIR